MVKICKKCGKEYIPTPSPFGTRQKYCDKCSAKAGIKTQEQLAKKAGRKINDSVQAESDKADTEGVSYGMYKAKNRKE